MQIWFFSVSIQNLPGYPAAQPWCVSAAAMVCVRKEWKNAGVRACPAICGGHHTPVL